MKNQSQRIIGFLPKQCTIIKEAFLSLISAVMVEISLRVDCIASARCVCSSTFESVDGNLHMLPKTRRNTTMPSGPNVSLVALTAICKAILRPILGFSSLIFL